MYRNKQSRWIAAIPVLLIALGITTGSVAVADEIYSPDTLFEDVGALDKFAWQEYALIERGEPDDIELPEPEPTLIAFAKDCADLDAIPLFEFTKDDERRLFVGINFDGVFGLHGQL